MESKKILLVPIVFLLYFSGVLYFYSTIDKSPLPEKVRSSLSPKADIESKKARGEYFFNMLRDPATNRIPSNIRQRELEFARSLKSNNLEKISAATWMEAGPVDVGGRTRAIAIDVANSNTIIVGGVSGGIWKSIDNGASWNLKSTSTQNLSVTSIAQDKRPGQTNVWYYGSGELQGSAGHQGGSQPFSGDGVYKSIDNGETWAVLPNTVSTNFTSWESPFDFVSKIVVSPTTGTVIVACNGYGVYRSADGGNTFQSVLGGPGQQRFVSVDIATNGTLLAVVSSVTAGGNPLALPGVYRSTDDGLNWTNINPASFPTAHARSVTAIAPSNSNVGYVLTFTGVRNNNIDDLRLHKFDIGAGTGVDLSASLPDFNAQKPGFGTINTQGSYNMLVAVKPDDENLVLVAGTSTFRSFDGFATQPADPKTAWIAGYGLNSFFHPNSHPDIHSFAFDPANPNAMWLGHDGGLSYTTNIANTNYTLDFPWENKNNGFNVTQFYQIAIHKNAGDTRLSGGTQDNGTPFFNFNGNATASNDISSGDGAYTYLGDNFAYSSSQNGNVLRIGYDQQGNASFNNTWTTIRPMGANGMLFIHPFTVDPNNEEVMYYPAGDVMWRNNALSTIPDFSNDPTSIGWTRLDNIKAAQFYSISTVAVSNNPQHILYFGATDFTNVSKIYRLENSTTATTGLVERDITGSPAGAYVHHIAVNPDDANEILVVLSNYNIVGLYHSADGGQTFTAVEGNLVGTAQNPGPSMRSATILTGPGTKTYFLATSIGVFSTTQLNGANTVWTQEGANVLGNVVSNYIVSRKSDGKVVVGTHGRGIFTGATVTDVSDGNILIESFKLNQNYPNPFNPATTISYTIPEQSFVELKVYNIKGEEITTLVNEEKSAGRYEVTFRSNKLASGVYIFSIKTDNFSSSRKMVLLK